MRSVGYLCRSAICVLITYGTVLYSAGCIGSKAGQKAPHFCNYTALLDSFDLRQSELDGNIPPDKRENWGDFKALSIGLYC